MRGREDIFLSMSESEKMSLFRRIVNARVASTPVVDRLAGERAGEPLIEEVNLKQIASLTGRNYGSVYNTYNGLVAALETMTHTKNASIKRLFNIPSSDVRLYFVQNGHPYQFLEALLTHGYPNFDAFLQAMDTSKATMLRHLKPLREFSRKFGVRFSYETLRIQGDEKRVRLFLTMIFWMATDGAGWPFERASRTEMGALVDQAVALYDVGTPNLVTREIAMYYAAVSKQRVADGNAIVYQPEHLTLKYPVANLFEAEAGPMGELQPQMTLSEQLGESAAMYFLFNFLPFYVTTSSTLIEQTIQRFKRYNPVIYTLVTEFLAKLPVAFLEDDLLPKETLNMLKANLFANTVSSLEFGEDISEMIAYEANNKLSQMPENPALAKKVRQTLEHVIFTNQFTGLADMIDPLSQSYYRNLLQLVIQFIPPVKVRVAPVVEQSVLGYIDLLSFLITQPFVEIVSPDEDLSTVDLVVESSTVPDAKEKRGGALTYKWAASTSNDWYGELYATIRQLWDEKMSLGGAVDY
ncbi:helix-turn-helix domain-containing protein [Lacticaseibacillus mingshuiensis]|uniref:helix-turn-helix domain-containing protein n=1 Tax=Lacticaseibacillus mingshuiensis TaxID=2799574 RepID=UPI00194F990E|nr:helix-turn-helix domain-containing protein [Lacticaseibacillus mingshuiensis]